MDIMTIILISAAVLVALACLIFLCCCLRSRASRPGDEERERGRTEPGLLPRELSVTYERERGDQTELDVLPREPSVTYEREVGVRLSAFNVKKHVLETCDSNREAEEFCVRRNKIDPTEVNTVFRVKPSEFCREPLNGKQVTTSTMSLWSFLIFLCVHVGYKIKKQNSLLEMQKVVGIQIQGNVR